MKFSADHHFIYITACADEHHQQLQSYHKLMEDDLEEINKEWLADLLVPMDPTEMSDVDNPATASNTTGPKIKNIEEVEDLYSASIKTASISSEQGGDGTEVEQKISFENLKKKNHKPPRL